MNNMKTETDNVYRHGDLLIVGVDSIPETAKKTDSLTLAIGEATGHNHSFSSGEVQMFENPTPKNDDPVKWFEVKSSEATLGHQEHKDIGIKRGIYALKIEREYNPFDNVVRQVTD